MSKSFEQLAGFEGGIFEHRVDAAAARDDQDVVVIEVFVRIQVVHVGFNGEAGGGGDGGRGGGEGAFEGFGFW